MTSSTPQHQRILVIDDSLAIGKVVQAAIESSVDFPVDYAASFAECERLLSDRGGQYQVAVVDLNLPDAPDGQAVDLVLSNGVAAIVLTGNMDKQMHERISVKPIVDYVIKQNPGSIETVQRSVKRTLRNMTRKVMVVDDSASFRAYLKAILGTQRLQVLEAANGKAALQELERMEDVALVVTDYEMPEMDGVCLTAALRSRFPSSRMAIVGLTGSDDTFLGVKFLKAGADDIVRKPFLAEEFVGRINNCMDHLDSILTIQDQANRDYLTKLFNRRYLFDSGAALFDSARRGDMRLSVAMVDIDFFKKINDTYGHDIGDLAIVGLAKALSAAFGGKNLVARMGGEEFCILAVNPSSSLDLLEKLRRDIEALEIPLPGNGKLRMTISIGVTDTLGENLDATINSADQALYDAKHGGRNRVVLK